MKKEIFFIWLSAVSLTLCSQKTILSFPEPTNYLPQEYLRTNNIFLIALLDLNKQGISEKIPILYSHFYDTDTSEFLIKGEDLENYSIKINKDNSFSPNFTPKALALPADYIKYLEEDRKKILKAKQNINLAEVIEFYKEPNWWQNDQTPLDSNSKPMKFICQIELGKITANDCCLYNFYDKSTKTVVNVYQWD